MYDQHLLGSGSDYKLLTILRAFTLFHAGNRQHIQILFYILSRCRGLECRIKVLVQGCDVELLYASMYYDRPCSIGECCSTCNSMTWHLL